MIKPIEFTDPVRLQIVKDGNIVADLFCKHGICGPIDIDGFKRVESIANPIDLRYTLRIEV